jgi:hypothetical protein
MIRAGDSIENPVTGERIVFRQTSCETNGAAVVIETYVQPNGFVPAAHLSLTVRGKEVTVPVKNNVWGYEESNSNAIEGRCIVVHFADGSTVDYPPTECS